MIIINPHIIFEDDFNGDFIIKKLERIGRTAYKSEDKIDKDSAIKFLKNIVKSGHLSVIEHISVTVRVICDRGITHEIVRHRIASYTQESTRYCNYASGKFENQITFIAPFYWNNENCQKKYEVWKKTMLIIEDSYKKLIELGATPQEARSVLPNSLKTEIVMTMNLREWLHFFNLRTSKRAHPQMREIAIPILKEFKERIPIIFDGVEFEDDIDSDSIHLTYSHGK